MKLNLKLLGTLFGGLALSMSASVASAYSVTYTDSTNLSLCTTGTSTSQVDFEASMVGCGAAADGELYKAEVPSGESGPFAGSYSTTFANTPTDPADSTISYTPGTTSIDCSTTEKCFLGVKDGNADPTYYIFDISGWDGTSSIVMTGFWGGTNGAISNVSIWSQGDGFIPPDVVPEPASLALVGIALLAAGAARRRRQA